MAFEVMERSLYNGRYRLVHNPFARGSQARYVVTDSETGLAIKPVGVTTLMGKTLGKDLISWAVNCMGEYLEGKLPVVTKLDLEEGAKEYERRRDAGAGTGAEAHEAVQKFLEGQAVDMAALSKEARNAVEAYMNWHAMATPEVLATEENIYSAEYIYAGTYDALLRLNGRVYLTDLKTTNPSTQAPNGIYADYYIQLGAYANAYEEQRQYEQAHGGTTLLEIEGVAVISCKKNGKLDLVTNEMLGLSVRDCAEMFKRVANLHKFRTSTTKLLGGR